jgi:hypothetical protein
MTTNDQNFALPGSGNSDWDSSLNSNFTIIGRGFHLSAQLGEAVNTGDALWINSGNFAFRFNPNSQSIRPRALAYTAGASGDTQQVLLTGIVRSLGVHSPVVPGLDVFVSALTPGMLVTSYSAANRKVGFGVSDWGVYFNPHGGDDFLPEQLTRTTTISNVLVGVDQFFSLDVGQRGIMRRVRMQGASGDLVSLGFWSSSARTDATRLFETKSGGVSVVGSFIDQAMFPYENTEASTISGLIFGRIRIASGSVVNSDTIGVTLTAERLF